MSLLAGGWLWLLLGVAVLIVAYMFTQRRKSGYAVRFTNLELLDSVAPKRPGWRRHATAAVFVLAISALVVALARPTRAEDVLVERATVVVAIDTSLSMEATDVSPSRLEAAQEAANALIDSLPEPINLGLVAFNGVAQITLAPTQDREAVRRAIDNLELGEATAIGEAIFTSLDAIELAPGGEEGSAGARTDDPGEDEEIPATIVVMSDGETTVGRPDIAATDAADEAGVPVSTIAFGTPDGTITVEGEPLPIPVQVDEESLRSIAEATGGAFFTAQTVNELSDAFADIGSRVGTETEQREITTWFLGLGVVLLLLTAIMSLLWFSRLP
jgi:Ca-activated chloride channel family protein